MPTGSPSIPSSADTLGHILARHADTSPHRAALAYFDTAGHQRSNTYAELYERAGRLGAVLAPLTGEGHARPFVLIALPNGLDYVASFFGCVLSGAAAVTFHPPALSTSRAGRNYDARTRRILDDCRPAAVIADASLHARFEQLSAEVGLRPLLVDPCTADAADLAPLPAPLARPDDLALLQYTSGSTSEPKGVMVSHANLVHNAAGLARNLGSGPGQTAVGWLPLFHDMGLIGMICHPVYAGMTVHMTTPAGFLRSPVSWLKEISRTRAAITIAPDFGYATAVRKIPEGKREGLDLSSLRHALSGAEPVRPRTVEEFAKAYAPYGFRRSALMPVYGLAEGTLCVTALDHQADPAFTDSSAAQLRAGKVRPAKEGPAVTLVGCGRAFTDDTDVAVVDPGRGLRMPDGEVGEIWVSGPSVAGGYWQREEATAQTFGARIEGEPARTYLRTGDLGVWYADHLHIVGRRKDVIVHHGVNHHPQDIEATAEDAHPAIGRAAALGIADATDSGPVHIVLLAESSDYNSRDIDHAAVATALRVSVTEVHGLPIAAVAVLRPGSVPRTTSGKVQRREAARRWEADEFNPLAVWRSDKAPKGA
ncbi:fatty acyl-AMP ligase [Streptomyces salinarius]|uniref:fatty acyl-AMP ligase n=1 Tax=Streptomyces salinarius TaxID=2762598 RepID=UPI0016481866|nr:fatty acyl-AMP ligase [Streptomyces salinarius]